MWHNKAKQALKKTILSLHNMTIPSSSDDSLSRDQIERYSRQLLLQDGFGVGGQQKLLSSSVLIIGAGGIGSTGKLVAGRQMAGGRLSSPFLDRN